MVWLQSLFCSLYDRPLTFKSRLCWLLSAPGEPTHPLCSRLQYAWLENRYKSFTRFSQEWSFGISCPGRGLKCYSGGGGAGNKMPTATKNGSSHDMCTKLLFVIYLPFLSESLASPSCLTVWECAAGYRSHPITLLLHFLSTVRALKRRSKSQPRSPRCGASVDQLRGNSTKAAAMWRNFSQGKCAMLSNLFLFFPFFSCLFPLLP